MVEAQCRSGRSARALMWWSKMVTGSVDRWFFWAANVMRARWLMQVDFWFYYWSMMSRLRLWWWCYAVKGRTQNGVLVSCAEQGGNDVSCCARGDLRLRRTEDLCVCCCALRRKKMKMHFARREREGSCEIRVCAICVFIVMRELHAAAAGEVRGLCWCCCCLNLKIGAATKPIETSVWLHTDDDDDFVVVEKMFQQDLTCFWSNSIQVCLIMQRMSRVF